MSYMEKTSKLRHFSSGISSSSAITYEGLSKPNSLNLLRITSMKIQEIEREKWNV